MDPMSRSFFRAGRLFVVALVAASGLAALPALSRMPDVAARSLNKESVDLRDGLNGSRNLVLLSFERSQTPELDTWSEPLRTVREDRADVDGYIVLIMGDLSRPLRAVIETAMRGRIEDDTERDRFLLMYGDRDDFLTGMGIDDTSSVLVVLLDASGRPLWQARGARTDEAVTALTAVLDGP
jgi:hypothetical protein